MRKLIFGINLTLDGCCDHTKGIADEELHNYYTQLLREADILLYGRKTYELMVPFWPDLAKKNSGQTDAITEFAKAFDSVKQIVVFSRSLEKAEGKNTRVIHTNLQEEILALKQQDGKSIMTGGVDIPSQLIALGLVDEYYFVVQPILVGKGRRLFEEVNLQQNLKLVSSTTFKSGSVGLRYVSSNVEV